jgi:hypothetical protein
MCITSQDIKYGKCSIPRIILYTRSRRLKKSIALARRLSLNATTMQMTISMSGNKVKYYIILVQGKFAKYVSQVLLHVKTKAHMRADIHAKIHCMCSV